MTVRKIADVNTPAVWGWVRMKKTGWVRKDGRKEYLAVLRAENDPFHVTQVEVRFSARHPYTLVREAVSRKRTTEELIAFLQREDR